MKVRDVMSTNLAWVHPDTSAADLAKEMRRLDIGALPVCNDRREVLGIVTDRDLVLRALAQGSTEKTAKQLMTREPLLATPNMRVHDALLIMAKYQIRRLPVVENCHLVGMLAMADVARKRFYADEAGDALSAISRVFPQN
ncbi:MAG: CBS domain-containing protein [Clostridiales bacterium]|nr:CBS domain-containing protein [Clostridiales bacterium]